MREPKRPTFDFITVQILVELGISTANMAELFGTSQYRVSKLIRQSGGERKKYGKRQVFQRALKRYAELHRNGARFDREQGVFQALRRLLRMHEFEERWLGLGDALSELTLPGGIENHDRPYRDLLIDLFRIESLRMGRYDQWRTYLSDLIVRPEERIPSSPEELFNGFVCEYVPLIRAWVCPPWPQQAREFVEYVLSQVLTPKHLSVLRPYYGLGASQQPTKEIARNLDVPIQTVRARRSGALEVLRHCEHVRALRSLVKPVRLKVKIPGQDPLLAVLCEPIEALELSVRAENCLSNVDIRYIGEVVRYTEDELLKFKNFGRTSIKFLKLRLLEYQEREGADELKLGMTFASEFLTRLEEELKRLRKLPPSLS